MKPTKPEQTCVICGKKYHPKPNVHNSVTCGRAKCQKERVKQARLAYLERHGRAVGPFSYNCPDFHPMPTVQPAPLRDDFERITEKPRPQ